MLEMVMLSRRNRQSEFCQLVISVVEEISVADSRPKWGLGFLGKLTTADHVCMLGWAHCFAFWTFWQLGRVRIIGRLTELGTEQSRF